MDEKWLPHPRISGLIISSHGRVKGTDGTFKKIYIVATGYAQCCGNKVHRLVAQTFIANPDNKPEVNHLDSNRSNNSLENLEWSTRTENMAHSVRMRMLKTPTSLLDAGVDIDKIVVTTGCVGVSKSLNSAIHNLSENGWTVTRIARELKIHKATVIRHTRKYGKI